MKRNKGEKNPVRLLFFDTETTGLPSRDKKIRKDPLSWPRLIEIGWVLTSDDGRILEKKSNLIIPESFVVPEAATLIHGITTEEAQKNGIPLSDALLEFCQTIHTADIIIAHNLSYDIRIIITELIRKQSRSQLPVISGICTMKSSAAFCAIPGKFGKGFKWPSLKFLYMSLFNTHPETAHRALDDAQTCARCYHELKRREVEMKAEDITRIFFRN